jgi:hypothetical protein
LKHFGEVWQPSLLSRRRTEDWLRRGGISLGDRLRAKTLALMERAPTSEPPARVQTEIEYIGRQG